MSRSKQWKRLKRTSVALALGVTGCGVTGNGPGAPTGTDAPDVTAAGDLSRAKPAPATSDAAVVDASIQESLDRLKALQLFTVEGLVLDLPAQARECYNLPCPGDTASWAAYRAERARQAPRLAQLATQAESCNSGNCYISTPMSAQEAVDALNALQVVRVGSLIEAQPKNNPECYNLPCESDKQAAQLENERRATVALTTAVYLKGSKL